MTQLTQDELDILRFMASGPAAVWPPNTFYKRPARSLLKRGLIAEVERGYMLTEEGREVFEASK